MASEMRRVAQALVATRSESFELGDFRRVQSCSKVLHRRLLDVME